MSPRPKNPPPDRRQDILEAALRVFASKGFAAATNADIAREAGVTPAALYYYFPSKADIFREAVDSRRETVMPHMQEIAMRMRDLPPEVVLPMIGRYLATMLTEERNQLLFRIVLAEGPRHPEVVAAWQNQMVGPMIPLVLGYIQHQMDQGRLRRVDPRVLGMMVNGPLFLMMIVRDLLKLEVAKDIDTEQFADALIHTLMAGLLLPANKE